MGGCSATSFFTALLLLLIDLRSEGMQTSLVMSCGAIRDTSADLSHCNLTRVPRNLPNETCSLDLSFNSITSLDRADLHNLRDLHFLSVSNNYLNSIQAQTFQDNPRLQILHLSSNALNVLPDLGGLPSLSILDLSENGYVSYSLRTSYSSLHRLSSLSLGSPNVVCIKKKDFSAVRSSSLEMLYLGSGAEMEEYQAGSLSQLTSLQELTLNMSFCKKPTVLQDILRDLHGSNVVNLTIVNPNFCNLSDVDPFEELKYMRDLRKFTLTNSNLRSSLLLKLIPDILNSSIDSVFFKEINYSEEGTVVINDIPGLNKTPNIRAIILERFYSQSEVMPKFFLNASLISSLSHLKLSDSRMRYCIFYNMISHLPSLQELDLSNQNLQSLGFSLPGPIFPALRKLILRKNSFDNLHVIVKNTHRMKCLECLDLSANRIRLWEKPSWPSSITHISLSENHLGKDVFHHLSPNFLSLNLSMNKIDSLSQNTLGSLKHLKALFLSFNKITHLPLNLSLNLEELHLDNNSINSLYKESFTGLPKLKKLKVGNNPFTCDCKLFWFLSSFDKSLLLDWPSDYMCVSPASLYGTALKDFHPGRFCDPMMQVAVFLPMAVCVCAALLLLFHTVGGAWYLRMLWVWLNVKRRGQNETERLLQANLQYHAFISYSQKDSYWVESQLIPHLERAHFSLCIHERDFVPGHYIIDNIINCVEGSYKTIFVLSQNFVQSEWCNYELFFSQHRALSERLDSMVFVLLEPIPVNSLPKRFLRLQRLLRQQTYLEWPAEGQKRRLFWTSLKAMLQPADSRVKLRTVAQDLVGLSQHLTGADQ